MMVFIPSFRPFSSRFTVEFALNCIESYWLVEFESNYLVHIFDTNP